MAEKSQTLSLFNDGVEVGLDMTAPTLGSLPKIQSKFHVPRLVDKPQNPIMDTLYLNRTKKFHADSGFMSLPPELAIVTGDIQARRDILGLDIWEDTSGTNCRSRVSLK
jgi:hypothetical protein